MVPRPSMSPLFPYTTLFRSSVIDKPRTELSKYAPRIETIKINPEKIGALIGPGGKTIKGIVAETGAEINIEDDGRSEEHTSELQSLTNLVCRLLLEKKKKRR